MMGRFFEQIFENKIQQSVTTLSKSKMQLQDPIGKGQQRRKEGKGVLYSLGTARSSVIKFVLESSIHVNKKIQLWILWGNSVHQGSCSLGCKTEINLVFYHVHAGIGHEYIKSGCGDFQGSLCPSGHQGLHWQTYHESAWSAHFQSCSMCLWKCSFLSISQQKF